MKSVQFVENFSRYLSLCFEIKKMLSMHLHHITGITDFFTKAFEFFSSKSATNEIAYGSVNFIAVAVSPKIC